MMRKRKKKRMSVIRCQNCKRFFDEPNEAWKSVIWGLCEESKQQNKEKEMECNKEKEKKKKEYKKKKSGKKKK